MVGGNRKESEKLGRGTYLRRIHTTKPLKVCKFCLWCVEGLRNEIKIRWDLENEVVGNRKEDSVGLLF